MAPDGLNKTATQLRLLNEVSTHVQSLVNHENFYQELISIIKSKFNYYAMQIWTRRADGRGIQLRAQDGAYRSHLQIGHTLSLEVGGITGHVFSTKRSYLANDVSQDPYYSNLSLPVQSKSQICVPVKSIADEDNPKPEIIATLNIESNEIGAFDEEDVITLESIAAQVAVAITNHNLFESAKDFNKKLQKAVNEKTVQLQQANEKILQQQKLLKKENKALKTLVDKGYEGADIVGGSAAIMSTLSMVDKIAPTTATVLIQGESGTGKELIARRLHFKSDRHNKPYVTVNCGALQESLLESELFGHEKGAFTGAVAQKLGLVETADGGTLFLDEIGEMSLAIQTKLLRFLQEGEFYRIGGKRPLKVDVRVLSATNRDLELEVKNGKFREDLFYRLNTITLRIPPLRKRKEDIQMLVDYFIKHSRFGGSAHQIKKIDPRVFEVFRNYDWPGNIRELQNTVERLKILAENNEIRLEDIPFGIRMPKTRTESSEFNVSLSLDEVEKNHILRALAFNHGNKTKTAQSLGITIKTLYNKLHRYGVVQPNQDQERYPS